MAEKRKEEGYSKKLAHFCDEVSNFSETPIIDNIKDCFERYSELDFLNEGGAKVIYRCLDNYTGREVAMAKLKDNSIPTRKERFLQEAQLTSSLQHPNIVPVYDLGLEDELPWFTMKFISGRSLYEILEEDKKNQLSPNDKLSRNLDYFLKVCDAIAYAHSKGVLHLDLKPDNIQIGNYGDLVVCDWGLANILAENCDENMLQFYSFNPFDKESVTIDGMIKGSPGYMAPEQASYKKAKKSEATDIFALGAILYTILCYEKPFKGPDLNQVLSNTCEGSYPPARKLNPASPEALEAICRKAMAVKPEDRYSSVLELQKEVLSYREGFATNAENAGIIKLLNLWIKRNKIVSALGGFSALLIIIFTVIYFEKINLEKENARQQAENSLQLAEKMRLEKDYAIKINKKAAPRFFERAQLAYSTFNIDDAVNFCGSAVELNPELTEAWHLKAELHFIKEEFNQALEALAHTKQSSALLKICDEFREVKNEDSIKLDPTDRLILIKRLRELKLTPLSIRYIHYKANSFMELDERIDFAYQTTLIMNNLKRMNFSYNKETRLLSLSNNKLLKTALAFQNFPAKSTDLSHTVINDFTSITNQKLHSLNISSTSISSLRHLTGHLNLLRELKISDTAIRSLLPIRNSQIESLDISWTDINTLQHLDSLANLKQITIHAGQFKKGELKKLKSLYEVTIKEKKN